MPIDPTIAAAIINASGRLLQQVLKLGFGKSSPNADKVMSKVYDTLVPAVTPNSLRVLIVLQQSGAFQLPEQLAGDAGKLANRQEPDGKPFELDITYRLRYLCLLGLIQQGTSDFALTELGAAFIEKARGDRMHYSKATALL